MKRPWLPPLLVGLLGAALFGSTWTDAVQVADSGEMITAACNAGVAHPPGFPLFTLLGHVFCQLPCFHPAGRVGLLSVLAGIWSLLALYSIVLQLTGSRWAAALSSLTLATGSIFWRYASLAEVFALNAALSLTTVAVALRTAAAITPRGHLLGAGITGLAWGLGLSNHPSSILILPLIAVAVLLPWRSPVRALIRILVALLGLGLGLFPYVHLLLADPQRLPRWGETATWAGLIHHVLRRDYGTLSLTLDGKAAPLQNLGHYLMQLPSQVGWILGLPALGGLVVLVARAWAHPLGRELEGRVRRDIAALLVFLPIIAGPGFLLLFNLEPEGIAAQVAERFYILPNALLSICLGVGLATLERTWLGNKGQDGCTAPDRNRYRAGLWRHAPWAVLTLMALFSYPRADVRQSYTVEDYALNSLASVERNALILGVGDVQVFSILYAQQMLGVRPDVQYVDVRLLLYPWYVAQKKHEHPGFSYQFQPRHVNTLRLIQSELRRGVPVYLAAVYNQQVRNAFGGYPVGPLLRLLPSGASPPKPQEVRELNERLFRGFLTRGRRPDPEVDPWSASLLEPYAMTWYSIARALHAAGENKAAQRALTRALEWAPWLTMPDDPPGRKLPDPLTVSPAPASPDE